MIIGRDKEFALDDLKAQTKFRGLKRVAASFTLTLAVYNLIRLPKLLENG